MNLLLHKQKMSLLHEETPWMHQGVRGTVIRTWSYPWLLFWSCGDLLYLLDACYLYATWNNPFYTQLKTRYNLTYPQAWLIFICIEETKQWLNRPSFTYLSKHIFIIIIFSYDKCTVMSQHKDLGVKFDLVFLSFVHAQLPETVF